MHTTTTFRIALVLCAAALPLAIAPAPAAAQGMCEQEDAGLCDDDGGVDAPTVDAGSDAGTGRDGGVDARDGGSGSGEGVACSCHTDTELDRGARIHVCTESFEPDVCRNFDCERGTVRSRGCPDEGVRLCCVMRSRDLQTSLYEDCAHPNCESGFREQCREFGGTVSEGACEGTDGGGSAGGGDDADESDGMCAVRGAPGGERGDRGAGGALPGAVLALLSLRLIRRWRWSAVWRARRPGSPARPL